MGQTPETIEEVTTRQVLIISGVSAFLAGFIDLMNNADSADATINKLISIIHNSLSISSPVNLFVALLFLSALGCFISYVYEPKTRVDAYIRGFSVYALLTVATPSDKASVSGINTTFIEENVHYASILPISPIIKKQSKDSLYTIEITLRTDTLHPFIKKPFKSVITIMDKKENLILGKENMYKNQFTITRPKGSYALLIESSGYERIRDIVDIDSTQMAYEYILNTSAIPLGFQKFMSPKKAKHSQRLFDSKNKARVRKQF